MCLSKILFPVFLFAFIFSLSLIFTLLAASISHLLTAAMKLPFSLLSPFSFKLFYFSCE